MREVALAAQTSVKPVGLAWVSGQRSAAVKRILAEKPDARVCAVRSPDDAARALGLLAQQTQLVARAAPPARGPAPAFGARAHRSAPQDGRRGPRRTPPCVDGERARPVLLAPGRALRRDGAGPGRGRRRPRGVGSGLSVVLKADAPGLARKGGTGARRTHALCARGRPHRVRAPARRLRSDRKPSALDGGRRREDAPAHARAGTRFAIVRDHVWGRPRIPARAACRANSTRNSPRRSRPSRSTSRARRCGAPRSRAPSGAFAGCRPSTPTVRRSFSVFLRRLRRDSRDP